MTTLLIEDLKDDSLALIKARATLHGWDFQNEVKAILDAAAATVDPKALRGWGELFPALNGEEEPTDSLALLEQAMSEVLPPQQAWTEAFLPKMDEVVDLDSVDLLEKAMLQDSDLAQAWVEHYLPVAS
jgi:hypothetical protein